MKRFFVRLFAWIGFLVVLLVAGGIGAWWWLSSRDDEARLPDNVVLTLRLRHQLAEEGPGDPWSRWLLRDRPSLRDLVDALDRARFDDRVRAVVADIGEARLGIAQSQELRQALARFRQTGKPAIAFADSFGELGTSAGGYYVATAFDEIWLQPSGEVGLVGISISSVFIRGLLDRLGVSPEFSRRREFKDAGTAVTDAGYSVPVRHMYEALARSMFEQIVGDVARDRRIDATQLRGIVDQAPHHAGEARRLGLVDRVGYWDEARAEAMRRAGGGALALGVARYLERAGRPHRSGTRVALIHASGLIVRGSGDRDPLFGHGPLGADYLVRAFDEAAADPKVAAILFRIDSPGGSYVGSDTIWRAVTRAREAGKPVVASMGDVAGSGGYFIAAPADRIVAQPGSLTGSIGVVSGKLVVKELASNLGITIDEVRIGQNAGMWSAGRPFSDAERAKLDAALDRVYEDFTEKVARGRNKTRAQIEEAAGGRIWTGVQARDVGLVDVLGGYQAAIDEIRHLAKLAPNDPIALTVYPKEREPYALLFDFLFDGEDARLGSLVAGLRAALRVAVGWAPAWERVMDLEPRFGAQRLMELPPFSVRN